jgi:uncharacterized protein DUF4198
MRTFSTAVAICIFAGAASAHDFWIEPSTFHPKVGERVSVSLRVGQNLQGDPVPRTPELIDRFIIKGSAREMPVPGFTRRDPAGYPTIAEPGLHWIGYQSNSTPLTLEAAKFEQYLKDEGLERIIDIRKGKGLSATPGRERFYRCAKSLLETPGSRAALEEPLGFTLELLPHRNPNAFSLLFRGKPIANVLVVALNKDETVRGRTDAKGRVALRLTRPGMWLIKAVHMEPAPAGAEVDWESWWASITFDSMAETPPPR